MKTGKQQTRDERWMQRAVELAKKAGEATRPNPRVGAVLVKGGKLKGAGFHRKAGEPHAEVMALRDAGTSAKGADLYVTLEPCSTQGRTPPLHPGHHQGWGKEGDLRIRGCGPEESGKSGSNPKKGRNSGHARGSGKRVREDQ